MAQQSSRRVSINNVANVVQKRTDVRFELDGGPDQVYSTRDEIRGGITLEHENDLVVNALTLTLEGACTTHVGNLSNSGPATGKARGKHHFLKLQHPIDASLLSGSAPVTGRCQIHIPFTFVVPERMLPGACNHKTSHENVKPAHLLLPPTLEEDHYAKAVQLARISYAIRIRISLRTEGGGALQNESRSFGIRIAPERDEEPPLGVYGDQHEYCLRRTVPIKSTFRKTLGELTAETSQPPCLQVCPLSPGVGSVDIEAKLIFIPTRQEELPPEIIATAVKLLEHTFFAATPFEELPRPRKTYAKMLLHRSYVEDFTISQGRLSHLSWSKQSERRSSVTNSTASTILPSSLTPDSVCYEASLLVPLTIPKIKTSKGLKKFPPSFHSCLVSRTHAVELDIHTKTNATITLTAPVQLVAKNSSQPSRSPTLPAATFVQIDRVLSFEAGEDAPDYEETPSHTGPQQGETLRRPFQVDELPDYIPDVNLRTGQTQRASNNRHSVSTTYEVPEQEWQNLTTG
jgi:hypothetical protein